MWSPGKTDNYSLMVIIQKIFDSRMQQVTSQNQAFQSAMKCRIMVYENCCFEASKSAELIIELKETAITFLHTPPQIIFILSRPYNCSCTADSHYSPDMVKNCTGFRNPRPSLNRAPATGTVEVTTPQLCFMQWPLAHHEALCKQNYSGGPQTFPFINSRKTWRP